MKKIEKFVPKKEWPSQITPKSTDEELVRCEELVGKWLRNDDDIDTLFPFWIMFKTMVEYIDAYNRNDIYFSWNNAMESMRLIMEIEKLVWADPELEDCLSMRDFENARYILVEKYGYYMDPNNNLFYLKDLAPF